VGFLRIFHSLRVVFQQQLELRERMQDTFRYDLAGDSGGQDHVLTLVWKKRFRKKPLFFVRDFCSWSFIEVLVPSLLH